jgi:2-dehydropantoate 2-reductase
MRTLGGFPKNIGAYSGKGIGFANAGFLNKVRGEQLRIAIIGSGAMGMLFGSYLSKENKVFLIDIDKAKVDTINQDGIRINEPDGNIITAGPEAAISAVGLGHMDLVILFVKAMNSRLALESNRRLIGPDTYVMSLQNGAGHDAVIKDFVAEDKIVIGMTQHNSSMIEPGVIRHGGGGKTFIGLTNGDGAELKSIMETFNRCGFETEISKKVQRNIWGKLFLNASASVLTAILQTKLGFVVDNRHAWKLAGQLIREAVAVSNAEGMAFEQEFILDEVHKVVEKAKDGYTSIYADIRDGRKTEVDFISGAVVAASKRNHVAAPCHEFVVGLIHAIEDKGHPVNNE